MICLYRISKNSSGRYIGVVAPNRGPPPRVETPEQAVVLDEADAVGVLQGLGVDGLRWLRRVNWAYFSVNI